MMRFEKLSKLSVEYKWHVSRKIIKISFVNAFFVIFNGQNVKKAAA